MKTEEKKKKYFKFRINKICANNMEDIHEKLQECLKTVSQEPFGKCLTEDSTYPQLPTQPKIFVHCSN